MREGVMRERVMREGVMRHAYCDGLLALSVAFTMQAVDLAAEQSGTLHSDSGGVAVARALEPLWETGEGWTVGERPLLEIGIAIGDPGYQLDGVIGAVRLSSGDIVLGDGGSGELRRYAPGGTLAWRAAGEGEGPGEHRFLSFLGVFGGDSLVSYDVALQRAQVFDAEGDLVRTIPVESPWRGARPTRAIGVSGAALVVTFEARAEAPAGGVVRWPAIRVASVDLSDGTIRKIADFPGAEQVIERQGGGVMYVAYHFGKGPRFAVGRGTLAAVDTEAFHVRFSSFEDGRTTRILHRDIAPSPVTAAHVDAEIEAYVERNVLYGGVTRARAEQMGRRRRDDPRAPTLPALRSIRLDKAGNLWVEPFFGAGIDVGPFEVFAADGTWLGSVPVPPGLERGFRPTRAPGLEIGDDYLLGVWSDAQGIEYVRLYSLDKS